MRILCLFQRCGANHRIYRGFRLRRFAEGEHWDATGERPADRNVAPGQDRSPARRGQQSVEPSLQSPGTFRLTLKLSGGDLGPVFWLLISEIFPLAIRGRGMSAATIANWLANLVVALTFLDLVDLLGRPGVFFVYAALAVGALWVGRASDKRPRKEVYDTHCAHREEALLSA